MPEKQRCKVEILAPAGSWDSMVAAARCGADAVYFGGTRMNARMSATNFDDQMLREAVAYLHARGVLAYQTLNTLLFDDEFTELEHALAIACAAGVDALIVQDLAVVRLVRERAPGMALHASTQMSVHSIEGVRQLESMGFSRAVLARELTQEEIAAIAASSTLELECFVHGALCRSVSGQCYLSSVIGGRSGNRGQCAQPCRLPFSCANHSHALSLRDLSLISSATEMAAIGVRALKIEGRMKRPEYVAAAVTACRKALAGEQPDYAALEAVFSRTGFTRGYYDGLRSREMLGVRRKEDVQASTPVLGQLAGLYREEQPLVEVDMSFTMRADTPVTLAVQDDDGHVVETTGELPQAARTAPTTPQKATAALRKTGGTWYTVRHVDAAIDEGLMLPTSQLNQLRRDALAALTAQRTIVQPHVWREMPLPALPPHHTDGRPWLRARLSRLEQLSAPLADAVQQITLPLREWARMDASLAQRYRDKLLLEVPGIAFAKREYFEKILQKVKGFGVQNAVVGSLDAMELAHKSGFALHGDYGLNITNGIALQEYARLGLKDVTLSMELELRRIRAMGGTLPRGLLAYGHLPLMVLRGCPLDDCARCKQGNPAVKDRTGREFFVNCDWQIARLYNCVPLVLSDRLHELGAVDFLTLYFTRESPEICAQVAELYRNGGEWLGERTRGLCYRKVK